MQPVFTLGDMNGKTGLVGGYFSLSKDISKAIADVSIKILNGSKASEIQTTKVNAGPVFNYENCLEPGWSLVFVRRIPIFMINLQIS